MLGAAAQNYGWPAWMALIAAAPLLPILDTPSFRRLWAALAAWYALFTLLTTHWIRYVGPGLGWLLLGVAVVYGAAFTSLVALALWGVGRAAPPGTRLLVFPAATMLAEMLARRALFGLTWALQGQPLADYPAFAQAASVAGPESLSFLAPATAVAAVVVFRRAPRWVVWTAIAQGPLLVAIAIGAGALRLRSASPPADTLRAGVVQAVVSQRTQWSKREVRAPMLQEVARLADRATAGTPDLIVLPEGALPGLVRFESDLTEFATGTVRRTRTPLLFGSLERDEQVQRYYNAAILITPYGTVTTYRKLNLVPFVEYVPLAPKRSAPWNAFTHGTEHTLFTLRGKPPFAAMICVEDIYANLAREFAREGAQALIALVNTEMYRPSGQPLQHLRRARLTAAAAGLPMLRVANSGITCSIDAYGRVEASLPPGAPAAGVLTLGMGQAPSIYRAAGDWPIAVLLVVGIAALALVVRLLADEAEGPA